MSTGNEALVTAVLDDWRTAPIDEKLRAMLGFLEKLTLSPDATNSEDIATLVSIGASEKAIEEAIYVCYLFNIIDRLADAFDFHLPDKKGHRLNGHILKNLGYKLASIPG